MARWQLQTAINRFSEVVRKAKEEGPQVITLRGEDAVVLVSAEEYRKLVERPRPRGSLLEFFRTSPLSGLSLDLARTSDLGRRVDL